MGENLRLKTNEELAEISMEKKARNVATSRALKAQEILYARQHYLDENGELNDREETTDENYSYPENEKFRHAMYRIHHRND